MSEAPVLLTREGSVAIVTLHRPAVGNAIDMPVAQGLLEAAAECAADAQVRAVLITGAGKLFCGGGDVAAFAGAGEALPGLLDGLADTLHRAILALLALPKPLVVAVNGPAAGAGLSLSLIGDVVIAGRAAHFTAAYGSLGLTPDGGMSWFLPRLIGLRRAQEMILANRRLSAEDAAQIGMITRTVDDAVLLDDGLQQAQRLAAAPVAAIGAARALLIDGSTASLAAQLDRERASICAAAQGSESREGLAAYSERRKPDFSGVS